MNFTVIVCGPGPVGNAFNLSRVIVCRSFGIWCMLIYFSLLPLCLQEAVLNETMTTSIPFSPKVDVRSGLPPSILRPSSCIWHGNILSCHTNLWHVSIFWELQAASQFKDLSTFIYIFNCITNLSPNVLSHSAKLVRNSYVGPPSAWSLDLWENWKVCKATYLHSSLSKICIVAFILAIRLGEFSSSNKNGIFM